MDSLLLATFVASLATLSLSTIIWHVVTGFAFAVMSVVHISLNWRWIRSVTKRRGRLARRVRANVRVDTVLGVAVAAVTVSGLALWAGWFELVAALHTPAAIVLLVGIGVHLLLHRRWIAGAAGRRG